MIHVLGSINIDYACTVATLPAAGETITGRALTLTPGGKGANQALAARRAGALVSMSGAVGSDQVADQALSLLKQDNVDLASVAKVDGPTGCAFVFVDAQSENQIVIIPGANDRVNNQQALELKVSQGDVLLLQLEIPRPAVIAAAAHASAKGATVIANLAPYQTMPPSFFESVDILLLNETEADQLAVDLGIDKTGGLAPQIATALSTTVVLTLGSQGVILVEKNSPAQTITGMNISAIDTVGAGDTFAGYLGAMLAAGHALSPACETANQAAALACTKPGAQTAIPTLEEVNQLAATSI